jgi:uncharacterized coiled-coil DUF342 family protein
MTFDEWWTQRETVAGYALDGADNASAAWEYQQERIDELKSQLEERQQKHLDSVRALRKANENVTKIAKDNLGLLGDIEVLEAKLKVSDIRPMEESAYVERIEELEDQVEWHRRRADGWRSMAILEEQCR